MNLDRTTRLVSESKLRIRDRVNAGTQFRSRYLDIAKQASAEIPATLPNWARQYLRGYADALLDNLNRESEFRYLIGEQWVNAKDLEYANDCRTPESCDHSGHVAATRNPPQATFWKGTDRIFFQSVDMIYGKVQAPA